MYTVRFDDYIPECNVLLSPDLPAFVLPFLPRLVFATRLMEGLARETSHCVRVTVRELVRVLFVSFPVITSVIFTEGPVSVSVLIGTNAQFHCAGSAQLVLVLVLLSHGKC